MDMTQADPNPKFPYSSESLDLLYKQSAMPSRHSRRALVGYAAVQVSPVCDQTFFQDGRNPRSAIAGVVANIWQLLALGH